MFIVTIGAGLGSARQRGGGSHRHPQAARSLGYSGESTSGRALLQELV